MAQPRSKTVIPSRQPGATARAVSLMLAILLLGGCAHWMNATSERLSRNLSQAILNQNDLETVKDGAPAYLLLIEGLLNANPDSEALLQAASGLYSTYTSLFVTDRPRALRLSDKALRYGKQALCQRHASACDYQTLALAAFTQSLDRLEPGDVASLYALGSAWAGWVQLRQDDWNALAQLPRVEALMLRVVELDEGYREGGAHLYLGVLGALIPAALGGHPERGRQHFERAITLSQQRNLMAKVLFARHYARLVFDRPLHDRLLQEVLASPADAEGLTLINTLAQQHAKVLLEGSDDYF